MVNDEETIGKIKSYCLEKGSAYEARPFGEFPICYKVMGKIFAQLNPQKEFYKMTLKCDPEQALAYRDLYKGIIVRGYHCPLVQQPYWNTIDLNQFYDEELLWQMIDEAYREVAKKLKRKEKMQLLSLSEFEFRNCDGSNSEFAMLCKKMDSNLDQLVGTSFQGRDYDQYNQRDHIHNVIVVYKNMIPVGCGCFRMFDDNHAELKRIFVDPTCRGMGLGAEIVRRLEAVAKIKGYQWCILAIGEPLKAASCVYRSLGYKVISNYGLYVNMEHTICMGKKI